MNRSPEEAINVGCLTPAHLQISSSQHNTKSVLQTSPTILLDTCGSSLLVSQREDAATPKLHRSYSIPLKLHMDVPKNQEYPRKSSLPLEFSDQDNTSSFELLSDFVPFRSKGSYENLTPNTHTSCQNLGKQAPKGNYSEKRKGCSPDPLHTLLLDNDPGVSLRGSRQGKCHRALGRFQGSSGRLTRHVQPSIHAQDMLLSSDVIDNKRLGRPLKSSLSADSPISSYIIDEKLGKPLKHSIIAADSRSSDSDSDTVQLNISEDPLKEFTEGITTEEDTPKEKLTPDVS